MEPETAAATACGIPSERDAALADRALEALIDGTRPESGRFGDEAVDLPKPTVRLLRETLDRMARGKGIHLPPFMPD